MRNKKIAQASNRARNFVKKFPWAKKNDAIKPCTEKLAGMKKQVIELRKQRVELRRSYYLAIKNKQKDESFRLKKERYAAVRKYKSLIIEFDLCKINMPRDI